MGDVTREQALEAALKDAMSALDYVLYHYGELYGVGFECVRNNGDAAIAMPPAQGVNFTRGWEAGRDAVVATLETIADGYAQGGDGAIACALRIVSAQARALTPPAPPPWTPPEDRPEGYRCWVWAEHDQRAGDWYRAEWHGGSDDPHWWVFGFGYCKHEDIKHFLPLPPAPEASHE